MAEKKNYKQSYYRPKPVPFTDLRELLELKKQQRGGDQQEGGVQELASGPPRDPPSLLRDSLRGDEPSTSQHRNDTFQRYGPRGRSSNRRRAGGSRYMQQDLDTQRTDKSLAPNIKVELSAATGLRKCTLDSVIKVEVSTDTDRNENSYDRGNFRGPRRGRGGYRAQYFYRGQNRRYPRNEGNRSNDPSMNQQTTQPQKEENRHNEDNRSNAKRNSDYKNKKGQMKKTAQVKVHEGETSIYNEAQCSKDREERSVEGKKFMLEKEEQCEDEKKSRGDQYKVGRNDRSANIDEVTGAADNPELVRRECINTNETNEENTGKNNDKGINKAKKHQEDNGDNHHHQEIDIKQNLERNVTDEASDSKHENNAKKITMKVIEDKKQQDEVQATCVDPPSKTSSHEGSVVIDRQEVQYSEQKETINSIEKSVIIGLQPEEAGNSHEKETIDLQVEETGNTQDKTTIGTGVSGTINVSSLSNNDSEF